MSRASIEQALTGLVPTLNGPLPSELIDIALSLLARSRSVANSLKPEEEIARPYACAQLACERLKKRLNLPSITSRPPCPPRVYTKLYNYLASALPDSTTPREPQTPRKNPTSAPASARSTPRTVKRTPQTAQKIDVGAGEPPAWVMPCIRTLAKKFAYPPAAPHIYTGVESILPLMARMSAAAAETPSKRARRAASTTQVPLGAVSDTKIFGLVVVVFLYVLTRMSDQNVTPEQYTERRERAVHTLLELPAAKNVTYAELSPETEELMTVAQQEGWLRMDWFLNVSPPMDVDEMEGVEATDGNTSHSTAGKTLGRKNGGSDYIGLGTMLQDATDYLGERQREDYKVWKAKIMARVEEIESGA
ncbi:hypothetical protein EKO04_006278 [Ascochyta lentis]|uniref:ORC6 first cyclin-like domain-containing protein n=1 Tax=Ascochyta lentis TaxID=205686 RepID=A0A8H7J3V8_9PLEO|nr:hypothetical protein EKO04_006278 [Ascochyta lentis]